MIRSRNQRRLVEIILKAADEGAFLTYDEIMAKLPPGSNKGTMRTCTRPLIEAGVLVKIRTGRIIIIKPTAEAYRLFRTG